MYRFFLPVPLCTWSSISVQLGLAIIDEIANEWMKICANKYSLLSIAFILTKQIDQQLAMRLEHH